MKVLIINAFWNNHGDEAANCSIAERLICDKHQVTVCWRVHEELMQKNNIPKSVHSVLLRDKRLNDAERLGYLLKHCIALFTSGKVILDSQIKVIYDELQKNDVVLYAPSGALGDNLGKNYIFPILLLAHAKRMNKPYIIYAPSLGPYNKKIKAIMVRFLLNHSDLICVRDPYSKRFALRLGVKKKIHTTIDAAIMHKIDVKACDLELKKDSALQGFLKKYNRIVGMTLTDFFWHKTYLNYEGKLEEIENAIYRLLDKYQKKNIGVIFIPQLFGELNDVKYLKKFQDTNTFILNSKYSCDIQQYVYSLCDYSIGMRYHSNIFAAKMQTPFIALSYDFKMKGFMKKLGLSKYCIDVNDITRENLLQLSDFIEENLKEYKKYLKKIALKLEKESLRTYEYMLEVTKGFN